MTVHCKVQAAAKLQKVSN